MDKKITNRNAGWGTLLIAFGLSALVNTLGFSEWYQIPVLVLAGLVAFVFYYRDRTDWVPLIPVYILLAGAAITAVAMSDLLDEDVLAVVILPIIAIPFFVVYFRSKKNWWALIPGYVLLLIAVMLLWTEVLGFNDDFFAGILMIGFAIPFLYVYFKDKQRWWALIPAYVFLLLGVLITLEEGFHVGDEAIAPGILAGIGLPFLYVYFRNRDNWWALIPAYAMLILATMIGLLEFNLLTDFAIPAFIMLAIAVPFLFVYLINNENSWALIPAGITGLMGLGFLFGTDIGKYFTPAVMVLLGIWILLRQFRK
jgi:hypothetical protein